MVAMDLKSEIKKLMEKRSALETEMNVIIERLCQPGGPGLSGNLVDSEGFPRSDIDIPLVRADRNRLAGLRNDHTDITEKIGQNIELLHAARLASKSSTAMDSGDVAGPNMHNISPSNGGGPISEMDVDVSRPFAMVDEITEESPAAEDGLQLGDQIVKFGNVEYGDNLLPRLASEAQMNQGHPVPMVVMRQGTSINLTVTPRTWQGRGLLGCNFRIL
ncbi:26S proteasome non-ATPase regulatory subunit 9 isoform X1 [Cynara cardunculus var. scolymus]|uniref:26S proteasome non-ATPase regulatory subunit 9 isoform X1 n=1 Tax=Cynara cardunculus var. scolymus TaxID=59895 RepID=UPI000D62DD1C|nr:26S proteasome non-ATPase regulatory subunit 9 isoform X1 [Cynara cardunculus var. scolymus]